MRSVFVQAHHWLEGPRRDVVRGRKVGVVEHVGVMGLHPLGDPLFVRPPAIPSAHRRILLRHVLFIGLVPRLPAPREDGFARSHQVDHDAPGRRGGKFDFLF